jgi:hypothetical protein
MRIHSRALLLLYCHIMEADYPYISMLNLALGALGHPPCWTFHKYRPDGSIEHNTRNEPIVLRHPGARIACLKSLTAAMSNGNAFNLDKLWNADIRNGFSHSQYFIEPNGSVILSQYHAGVSGTTFTEAQKHTLYVPHADLHQMYLAAQEYLSAFVVQYKNLVKPYKDGGHYHIGLRSPVTWNAERERWDFAPDT